MFDLADIPGRKELSLSNPPVYGDPAFLPPLFLLAIPKALPESSFPLSNWIGAY